MKETYSLMYSEKRLKENMIGLQGFLLCTKDHGTLRTDYANFYR